MSDWYNEERSPILPYVEPKKIKNEHYPHKCGCGAAAYVGAFVIECSNNSCKHYKPDPNRPKRELFGEDLLD